jgi:hypothetical protein
MQVMACSLMAVNGQILARSVVPKVSRATQDPEERLEQLEPRAMPEFRESRVIRVTQASRG